MTLLAFHSW